MRAIWGLLLLVCSSITNAENLKAGLLNLENETGHVEFVAHTTAGLLTVHGNSDAKIQGQINIKEGHLVAAIGKFGLASLDTGISPRNSHMKKALSTDKWPFSTLAITRASADGKSWSGTLSLHGKVAPISGEMTLLEDEYSFSLVIPLDRFDIKAPSFAGVTVKNEIDVKIVIKGGQKNEKNTNSATTITNHGGY